MTSAKFEGNYNNAGSFTWGFDSDDIDIIDKKGNPIHKAGPSRDMLKNKPDVVAEPKLHKLQDLV